MDLDMMRGNPFHLDSEAVSWVQKTKDSMTLREKIGQIFIPICADYSRENIQRLLRYKPGGIHQFLRTDLKKLRSTTETLQKSTSIPLLMTADIEFNISNMLSSGTHLPMELGVAATGDVAMARRMGIIAGREGRYCGFNWFVFT